MLNKEYTHFEDYYKESFAPVYERFKSVIADERNGAEALYKSVSELYKTSCELMKFYSWNNGFYITTPLDYIKNLFRLEIITYGEEWIILGDMVENPSKVSAREFVQFVLDNSKIFDEFAEKMRSLATNV